MAMPPHLPFCKINSSKWQFRGLLIQFLICHRHVELSLLNETELVKYIEYVTYLFQFFTKSKFVRSIRSDWYKVLFLGIIAIHILKGMIISGDQPLPESVYVKKYLIPTKSESESSYLDLSNLPHLTEIIRSIVKNSITITFCFALWCCSHVLSFALKVNASEARILSVSKMFHLVSPKYLKVKQ